MKRFALLTIAAALIMGGCSDADNILSSIESVEVDTAPAPSANTPLMDFSGGGILSPASACDPDPQGGVGGKVLSLSCIEDPSDPGGEVSDTTNYCSTFVAGLGVTCKRAEMGFVSWIIDHFNAPGFRRSNPNCIAVRDALFHLIEFKGQAYQGGHSHEEANVLMDIGGQAAYAVWFNTELMSYPDSAYRRVIGHEGFHAAYFDGDHEKGNRAGRYCFGHSSDDPWAS